MVNSLLLALLRFTVVIGFAIHALPVHSVSAAGSTYRVKSGGITSGACGNTWDTSCDLQYAISLAQAGDQLWVAEGTYTPTSGIDRTISFRLKSGVAIYGGFTGSETELTGRDPATNVTVLSGDIGVAGDTSDNSYHVVYGVSLTETTVLDGFKISAGNANGIAPHDLGGGMYCYSCTAMLSRITFTNNNSQLLGGGLYNKISNLILNDVEFFQNSSGSNGGGHYNHTSNLTLTNVSFTGNTSLERGGGLYNYDSTTIMSNASFINNSAQVLGGGLNNYSSDVQLTMGTFASNSAGTSGGGIYTGGGTLKLIDVVFTGNTAKGGGGMLNSSNSLVTILNATFEENYATERGGGIYNYESAGSLTNGVFKNNTAKEHGGAMFNSSSNPILTEVTFTGNTSEEYGGAIDNNSSSPIFNQVSFTNNSAMRGGGVYNWEYSSPIINDAIFVNNHASHRGGGMYNVDYCDFTLNDAIFEGNTSMSEGAGMYISNSNPSLNRVVFLNNITPAAGGGIYNSYTHGTLNDVLFENNSALNGGGLNNNNSDPALTNVTFTGNIAQERGGGLYNYSSDPKLVNVTFEKNTAGTYGGGNSNSAGSLNVNNVTFNNNSSGGYGGGMWLDDTDIYIYNSIFWGNSAISSGSQIYSNQIGNPVINNSVMQNGCPSGAVCTDILTTDPLLGTLGDYGGFTPTIPLLLGSSAIDTANDAACATTDQRGVSRPQGISCDIGAYEFEFAELFSISGRVLDESGASIPGVIISDEAGRSVTTDAEGNYIFTGFPQGSHTIIPAKTGYTFDPQTVEITINDQAVSGLDFTGAPVPSFYFSPAMGQILTTSKVTFDWDDVGSAELYKIQLSTTEDFSTYVIKTKTLESRYVYEIPLQNSKQYFWRVKSYANGEWSSWFPTWSFMSMDPLTAPLLQSPDHKATILSSVTLSWSSVVNGVSYRIVIATDNTFTTKVINQKMVAQSASYNLPNGKYFWRVRAFDASGVKGPWSEVRKFFISTSP